MEVKIHVAQSNFQNSIISFGYVNFLAKQLLGIWFKTAAIILKPDHTALFLQICFTGILFKNTLTKWVPQKTKNVVLEKFLEYNHALQGYIFVFWGSHLVDFFWTIYPWNKFEEKAQCADVWLLPAKPWKLDTYILFTAS